MYMGWPKKPLYEWLIRDTNCTVIPCYKCAELEAEVERLKDLLDMVLRRNDENT